MVEHERVSGRRAHGVGRRQALRKRAHALAVGDAVRTPTLGHVVHVEAGVAALEIDSARVEVHLHSEHGHLLPRQQLAAVVMRREVPAAEVADVPPVVGEPGEAPARAVDDQDLGHERAQPGEHRPAHAGVDGVDPLAHAVSRLEVAWGREVEALHGGNQGAALGAAEELVNHPHRAVVPLQEHEARACACASRGARRGPGRGQQVPEARLRHRQCCC
mmetsp:Transcript_88237/g.233418  ORF Transcript_88237/g.233418 Transcript_88237/m.233418 type:complete len:218 (+) Transcript_88237:1327-1980(+)